MRLNHLPIDLLVIYYTVSQVMNQASELEIQPSEIQPTEIQPTELQRKKDAYDYREKCWREECNRLKETYYPPTFVQFDVMTRTDLNPENEKKMQKIIEAAEEYEYMSPYSEESLLSEIRKYDTSILDEVWRNGICRRY